jgi:hypothetical protein
MERWANAMPRLQGNRDAGDSLPKHGYMLSFMVTMNACQRDSISDFISGTLGFKLSTTTNGELSVFRGVHFEIDTGFGVRYLQGSNYFDYSMYWQQQ